MDKNLKRRWIRALRSGKYPKGKGALHTLGATRKEDTFCCLGVLAQLAVKDGIIKPKIVEDEKVARYGRTDREGAFLPAKICKWAGIPRRSLGKIADPQYLLADQNDHSDSFEEVIPLINELL